MLENLQPKNVFRFFEEISSVPRGSGNMTKIADYCEAFAIKNSLKYVRDGADNLIIYKPATKGFENSEPIILQGHLDIVCQKTEEKVIDFTKDGLDILVDGDFVTADGTTLGADNGIAVSMILAILESDEYSHPAIEAVLTTDEEIGMIGATKLDTKLLKSKKMINLDSEEENIMTVSCAGGSDIKVVFENERETVNGTRVKVCLKGFSGGHSGVEIHKGRVNSNILAGRFLNHIKDICKIRLIKINGGDKGNAITNNTEIEICTNEPELFKSEAEKYLNLIKDEIKTRESNFKFSLEIAESAEFDVFSSKLESDVIYSLLCVPNGVVDMSAEIENLVETSLNLGILKTTDEGVAMGLALRSNKQTALEFLEEKIKAFFASQNCKTESFGHYPSWEFNSKSTLQDLYKKTFKEVYGYDVKAEALHAGLECGVFASKIKDFDCIAIGPQMYDVHTVNERLSIKSTERIFRLLLKVLEASK